MNNKVKIQFKGIGPLWTEEKPWAVIITYTTGMPYAKIFETEQAASEFAMMKKLEQ